jgi:acyl-lipid omega-6 desaturase (Delta-12 desaturase)
MPAPRLCADDPARVFHGGMAVYIQHQFEDTYWAAQPDWDFGAAALQGSSFYDLPRILHWLTGYIGFHHIHHLSSKVPNYHLRACFEQNSEFWQAKRLTLLDSLRCPRLALWDEEYRRLVPFPGRCRPAFETTLSIPCGI